MLMMSVSQETATKLFSMLEDDEIKDISHTMANMGNVNSEFVDKLIMDYSTEITSASSFVGNIQNTERFLRKILGKDKVEIILEEIRGPAGKNVWDKLSNVNEEVLANYVKNEYPQTAALILSKIPAIQAANVLKTLNKDFAFEIVKRMLIMDTVKKEVLEKVEKTLRTEFIGSLTNIQKYDTNQIMAEIFNNFDRATEAKYMEMLEDYDREAAEQIKKLMFTFEDVGKIDNAGIQAILKVADKSKLAIALKGASEDVRKKFIENMSQRAAKILQEEIDGMGPVKMKDVEEAQNQIINIAKDLIAKGEIVVSQGGEADQMVY